MLLIGSFMPKIDEIMSARYPIAFPIKLWELNSIFFLLKRIFLTLETSFYRMVRFVYIVVYMNTIIKS